MRKLILPLLLALSACKPPTPPTPPPTVQQVQVALSPQVANCNFHLQSADSHPYSGDWSQPGLPYSPANFQQVPWLVTSVTASVSCTGYTASPITALTAGTGHTSITLQLTANVPPLPPVPSRDQLAQVVAGFQGITVTTSQLGGVPSWGPEVGMLSAASDRQITYAAHKAAGATHFVIDITCHYNEPGVAYPGNQACNNDWQSQPQVTAAYVAEIVRAGLYPVLALGGDEVPFSTIRANLPALWNALKNSPSGDLTPYIVWTLGFDSIVPIAAANDTTVQDLIDTLLAIRSTIGNGVQFLELPNGWAFWGPTDSQFNLAGVGSYTSPAGQALDGIFQEFANVSPGNDPTPAITSGTWDAEHNDYSPVFSSDATAWMQVWQVAARTAPHWQAPPDEPTSNNPVTVPVTGNGQTTGQVYADVANPAKYTRPTPRGQFYAIAFEFGTYQWTHGQVNSAAVANAAKYLASVGYDAVCYPLHSASPLAWHK